MSNRVTPVSQADLAFWMDAVERRLSSLEAFAQGFPAGVLVKWAGNISTLPPEFIQAAGQVVSRSQYPAVHRVAQQRADYNAGDGSTTFGVPNEPGYIIKI